MIFTTRDLDILRFHPLVPLCAGERSDRRVFQG